MKDFIIILCTINDLNTAKDISRHLLENNLVACVNIIPDVVSMYQWKDEICEDTEYLMVMKTTADMFNAVKTEIKKLHSYEIPEIISVNIEEGANDYLSWINSVVNSYRQSDL